MRYTFKWSNLSSILKQSLNETKKNDETIMHKLSRHLLNGMPFGTKSSEKNSHNNYRRFTTER
ncbi:hypothetical protein DMA11_20720 [Marinilabiliaceae bacterium JC017]|nr:hypothetical protein DMA11_20720 [Marinilabiliaceae bacterium JC017]